MDGQSTHSMYVHTQSAYAKRAPKMATEYHKIVLLILSLSFRSSWLFACTQCYRFNVTIMR